MDLSCQPERQRQFVSLPQPALPLAEYRSSALNRHYQTHHHPHHQRHDSPQATLRAYHESCNHLPHPLINKTIPHSHLNYTNPPERA